MSKYRRVLKAGKAFLDAKTRYNGGDFLKDGKTLKLSLEKVDDATFWELFMDYYFFRSDKKYNAARKLLAKAGVRNKTPMEMEYIEQQYKLKIPYKHKGKSGQMVVNYSPAIGHVVVRKL